MKTTFDVIIIGAGPAGTVCAANLNAHGLKTLILEREQFPRFAIGESFLSQNIALLAEAGLEHIFKQHNFQQKDGAQFLLGEEFRDINFSEKFTAGPSLTYQVLREDFDHILAKEVEKMGTEILFKHQVTSVEFLAQEYPVKVAALDLASNTNKNFSAKFIVDASGLGKVLPKLLKLPTEYGAQNRKSYFNHFRSQTACSFDNNKILITIDRENRKNWFWTIPLGNNRYSIGVTTEEEFAALDNQTVLDLMIARNPTFRNLLGDFTYLNETRMIKSFTSKTDTQFGKHFVLIGNSGEFLDPIFSSGVTIALKSASLASKLIINQLQNIEVDWKTQYVEELNLGLNTFKSFVNAWYTEELQQIIYAKKIDQDIKKMIVSILAGYAWDRENYFTKSTSRRLKSLAVMANL